jgi:hypothetical protein
MAALSWRDEVINGQLVRTMVLIDPATGEAYRADGSGSEPLGFSTITALSAAKGLHQGDLGAIPTGAKKAWIQVEDQDVRWRDDGENPTASEGHLLMAGATLEYDRDLAAIRFIEVAASAVLTVSFYT